VFGELVDFCFIPLLTLPTFRWLKMKPRPTISFRHIPRSGRVPLRTQCSCGFHNIRVSTYCSSQHGVYPRQAHTSIRFTSSAAAVTKSPPYPSSYTTKPTVPAQSHTSNVLVPQVLAKLNPPPETYAPELSIPSKRPAQSYFKYLYQCGKLYIQFYKQGIKNVRATSKIAKSLRQKLEREKGKSKDAKLDSQGLSVLTRAEWQIVRRSRQDMMRLPAFGALVLIFGEWLPLLALYITPVVPEPCRIPAQIKRKLEKAATRRRERERRLALDAARLVSRDRKPGSIGTGVVAPQAVQVEALEKMDLFALLSLSTRLDCHGGIWDKLFLTPPKPVLKWALKRRIDYLRNDDGLIERDGGWQGLNEQEIERACTERGVDILGKKKEVLRREIAAWFKK
jgi:hypothetical protein